MLSDAKNAKGTWRHRRDSEKPSTWAKLAGTRLGQSVLHDWPAMARSSLECCCEVGRIEETWLRAPSCSQLTGEMERWEHERPMLANNGRPSCRARCTLNACHACALQNAKINMRQMMSSLKRQIKWSLIKPGLRYIVFVNSQAPTETTRPRVRSGSDTPDNRKGQKNFSGKKLWWNFQLFWWVYPQYFWSQRKMAVRDQSSTWKCYTTL